MLTMILDPKNAEPFLDETYAHTPPLGERIDDSLDDLLANPGDARFRPRLIRPESRVDLPSSWAYVVRHGSTEVMVVWYEEDDVIWVPYIGPSIF